MLVKFAKFLLEGYTYERLDGSVRGEERYLAVNNFNESDETFIFLLSTRAGNSPSLSKIEVSCSTLLNVSISELIGQFESDYDLVNGIYIS